MIAYQNHQTKDWAGLWPRFLYVYARVPAFPLPILIFLPTIVVESVAGFVLRWASKDAHAEERARLMAVLQGIRLLRQMGRLTLVDLEVKDMARFAQTDSRWLSGGVRVKIGQW